MTDKLHASGLPEHHRRGRYRNPPGSPPRTAGRREFLAFLMGMRRIGVPEIPDGHVLDRAQVEAQYAAAGNQESVTWLGHAAFLLRMAGKTVLLDPYLSEYASPIPGFGPKRFVPAAIPVDRLPPVDVLVLSHNHYDHLDEVTIRALPGKDRMQVVVPLGLGVFFRRRGFAHVTELDWHQSAAFDGLRLTAVPAIHFTARGLLDRHKTLWAGFVLESAEHKVYFGGDSAYGPVFAETGRRHGPFDLALLGIGAYEPRSIMVASHATPEESVRMAQDLGARTVMGMHWGTIRLTPEPPFEAPERFRAAARAAGIGDADAWIMAVGETRGLPNGRAG